MEVGDSSSRPRGDEPAETGDDGRVYDPFANLIQEAVRKQSLNIPSTLPRMSIVAPPSVTDGPGVGECSEDVQVPLGEWRKSMTDGALGGWKSEGFGHFVNSEGMDPPGAPDVLNSSSKSVAETVHSRSRSVRFSTDEQGDDGNEVLSTSPTALKGILRKDKGKQREHNASISSMASAGSAPLWEDDALDGIEGQPVSGGDEGQAAGVSAGHRGSMRLSSADLQSVLPPNGDDVADTGSASPTITDSSEDLDDKDVEDICTNLQKILEERQKKGESVEEPDIGPSLSESVAGSSSGAIDYISSSLEAEEVAGSSTSGAGGVVPPAGMDVLERSSKRTESLDHLIPPTTPGGTGPSWQRSRQLIAEEILSTEKSYVHGLETLRETFMIPFLKMVEGPLPDGVKPILSAQDLSQIFSNIDVIYQTNVEFMKVLAPAVLRLGVDGNAQLGQVFVDFAYFFRQYTQYCNNFEMSRQTLSRLQATNPAFSQFVKDQEKGSTLHLGSLLITPIQRIPRYKLLLGDLRKHTPSDHPDWSGVNKAYDLVDETADKVNESMRRADNQRQIIRIQSLFAGNAVGGIVSASPRRSLGNGLLGRGIAPLQLLEPHRLFVREGMLQKLCRRGPKRFMFFLFNDLLIYGEVLPMAVGTAKYMFHRSMELLNTRVEDNPDPNYNHSFTIHSAEKSFVAIAKDEETKTAWVNDIQRCVMERVQDHEKRRSRMVPGSSDELEARRKSRVVFAEKSPQLQKESDAKACSQCGVVFGIITPRRRHCGLCGRVYCGQCTNRRCQVVGKPKPVRSCDLCFTLRMSKLEQPEADKPLIDIV